MSNHTNINGNSFIKSAFVSIYELYQLVFFYRMRYIIVCCGRPVLILLSKSRPEPSQRCNDKIACLGQKNFHSYRFLFPIMQMFFLLKTNIESADNSDEIKHIIELISNSSQHFLYFLLLPIF